MISKILTFIHLMNFYISIILLMVMLTEKLKKNTFWNREKNVVLLVDVLPLKPEYV
jgi:hypothetical protein